MKRPIILLGLAALLSVSTIMCSAQTARSDTDRLHRAFLDPPQDFSPMPFWFWNGKMEGPIVQKQIRDMVDQHVYGAFLHGRDGLETPYLSDGWFKAIGAGLEQSKSRASNSISSMSTIGPAAKYETYGWPAIIRAKC